MLPSPILKMLFNGDVDVVLTFEANVAAAAIGNDDDVDDDRAAEVAVVVKTITADVLAAT